MRKILLTLSLLLAVVSIKAQDDPEYRMEFGAGLGVVSYEGDFNENVLKNMAPIGSLLLRYNFDPYMGLKLSASYGKLKGSSKDLKTYYPEYQTTSYEFNNSLVDVSLVYEYNFWPYGTGRDYRGSKRVTPFIFGGIGTTVASGSKSVFTMNIPLGVGVKYKASERMNIGVEWAMHFSMSDELDGVSDPYQIKSTGIFKNKDCYSALQLTLTYSFGAKCRVCNNEYND